jgi:sterol O-acyltransferase
MQVSAPLVDVGKKLICQMFQLPLIFIARTKFFKKRQLLGHVMFWVGIFTGPSLLSLLYLMF